MDEKQKKQIELIRSALTSVEYLDIAEASKCIERAAKNVLSGLSAFDIIQGHSEKMLAANALMQIHKQIELLYHGHE